jgi:large subunit ribosomal protein L9
MKVSSMKVFLLKDIPNVGFAGTVVSVSDGYAANFLFPRKLAQKVTEGGEQFFVAKVKKAEAEAAAVSSKMGMMAERLKASKLTLKKRAHDDGKLYGSVSADEVVQLLKDKEFSVTKKQVVFTKSIKTAGTHSVQIKLSSKLLPEVTLVVVGTES